MTGTVNRVLGVMTLAVAFAAMGSAENTKKKANSDIENIGNRDINKGSINFISLNKEIWLKGFPSRSTFSTSQTPATIATAVPYSCPA